MIDDETKVLVTGGAGFIGSHIVGALLADGVDVNVLDNLDPAARAEPPDYLDLRARYVLGDVRDAGAWAEALTGVSAVCHQAGEVGLGVPRSVGAMAEALARAFGAAPGDPRWPTVTDEYRLGDVRHVFADVARASDELGLTASIAFDDGMGRFATDPLRAPVAGRERFTKLRAGPGTSKGAPA